MGSVDWLLNVELFLIVVAGSSCGWLSFKRADPLRWMWLALATLAGIIFFNQILSSGRAILAPGIVLPGTQLTRCFILELEPWMRRSIDPILWLFFSVQYIAGRAVGSKCLKAAAISSVLALAVESCLLIPGIFSFVPRELMYAGHLTVTVVSLGLLGCGLTTSAYKLAGKFSFECRVDLRPTIIRVFAIALAVQTACFAIAYELGKRQTLTVGAHYYSWFPENWVAGTVWSKLLPPIVPILGQYHSDDLKIFNQHADWAKQYGIDFFIFDWWPQRLAISRRVKKYVSSGIIPDGVSYCLMYETSDLKESGDQLGFDEPSNVVYLSSQRIWRLKKHWEYLAREFMHHRQYLRFDKRAVLFVYTSRHLVGPVLSAIREARAHVLETTGVELFLVGDEAYYSVLDFSEKRGAFVLPEYQANWERISAFDALTAYNPYDTTRAHFAGSLGASQWFSEVGELYRRYKSIGSTVGIPFIPTALPGYNDRGVRPKENHYVLPRILELDQDRSFFAENLRRLILPFSDKIFPVFTVTSWNEWNEGTQIEPTRESAATRLDASSSGKDFTAGEIYRGYGLEHLAELKRFRHDFSNGVIARRR